MKVRYECDGKCSECTCSVVAEDCCPYDENRAREKNTTKITLEDLVKIFDLKTVGRVVVSEEGIDPVEFTSEELETHLKSYAFKTVEKFSVRADFLPMTLSLELKD